MDNNTHRNNFPRTLWLLIGLALLVIIGGAGFLLGRSTAPEQVMVMETPVPIVEIQEVTREVITEVTVISKEPELPTEVPASSTPTTEKIVPADNPAVSETLSPIESTPESTQEPEDNLNQGPLLEEVDFTTFNEAWQLIEGEYDGELPDPKELLYSAIAGSLETLDDDYTRYVRPEIAERFREDMSGSISGIGAFVRENDEGLVEIVRPFDGQPADLAGLLAGDVIIEIDGLSVVNTSFDEALMMIRGPEGTSVTLTIVRDGIEEPFEFSITRKLIEIPIVETEIFGEEDNKIGYLRLTSFTSNADSAVLNAMNNILAESPKGLIFDLRDNGGGFLDQAVAVADTFLPESVILYERGSKGIDEVFQADNGDLGEQIPLVVLVNAGSASASEIVAGAIQDNDRGLLIGETTFGKGSVQLVHTLSDGSELRVTIARWYTPMDRSISKEGIDPDIEIPTPLDLGGEDDAQIQRAIEYLLNNG